MRQAGSFLALAYHSFYGVEPCLLFSIHYETVLFNARFENCDALGDLVPFVQFKNVKNTHGGVLILVKLQAEACNFTKINIPPWVFFTIFKFDKWYQTVQRSTILSLKVLK